MSPIPPAELPGELAGPLHFPDAQAAGWLLPLLLAAALWAAARWWWRRRHRATAPPAARPLPAVPTPEGAIRELRERHLARRTYRGGCHELAALLKEHFERLGFGARGRPPCTRLTAWEIERRVGERPATHLLAALGELRFGRAEPRGKDFRAACDLALEVVGEGEGR